MFTGLGGSFRIFPFSNGNFDSSVPGVCFWVWPLSHGLEQFHEMESSGKLPREEAEEIFSGVEAMIDHPEQLQELYSQLLVASGLATVTDDEYLAQKSTSPNAQSWPSSLYHGQIEPVQAVSLGF